MQYSYFMWSSFFIVVGILLTLDLCVINKGSEELSVKKNMYTSAFYITIGILFGFWIWSHLGEQYAKEYWTGFLLEKSLSFDNIFIMSVVFAFFSVPPPLQHRVLFWGILGVIVLRGIMIGLGATLLHSFSYSLWFFSFFLIYTGIKMLTTADNPDEFGNHKIVKFLQKHMRVTPKFHGNKFFIKKKDPVTHHAKLWCTPLFLALSVIEFMDLIFAVDSIPAIFSITTNPYIVYTSNIFAILGLRSLYTSLAIMVHRFVYLKYSLALILIFIGVKFFLAKLFGFEIISVTMSLFVVAFLLLGGILFSLYKTRFYIPMQHK